MEIIFEDQLFLYLGVIDDIMKMSVIGNKLE